VSSETEEGEAATTKKFDFGEGAEENDEEWCRSPSDFFGAEAELSEKVRRVSDSGSSTPPPPPLLLLVLSLPVPSPGTMDPVGEKNDIPDLSKEL